MPPKPARKELIWFSPWGWTYRPINAAGWLLVTVAVLFSLQVIGEAYLAYRTLSAVVFVSFPYVISTGTLYTWIASKTTAKN